MQSVFSVGSTASSEVSGASILKYRYALGIPTYIIIKTFDSCSIAKSTPIIQYNYILPVR